MNDLIETLARARGIEQEYTTEIAELEQEIAETKIAKRLVYVRQDLLRVAKLDVKSAEKAVRAALGFEAVDQPEETEIDTLIAEYTARLSEEYNANAEVIEAKEALEVSKAKALTEAQAEGKIDGKNADTRKRQAEAALLESVLVDAGKSILWKCESEAASAQIRRKAHQARIELTKATLYSQSRY